MAGFVASEAVEDLTYDFRPHVENHGQIPEPTSNQIEEYRSVIFEGIKSLGLENEDIKNLGATLNFDQVFDLMDKAGDMEDSMLVATATLTGIPREDIEALPYRVKRAFLGWIMGTFFDPEA